MAIPLTRFAVAAGLLASLAGGSASAADNPGAMSDRATAEQSLMTVPSVADVQRPGIFLSAQASANGKTGTASAATENRDGTLTTSLTFSAPLDASTRDSVPLTLKGLQNSSNASLGLHWFHWPGRIDVDAQKQVCQAALSKEYCRLDELTDPQQRGHFIKAAHAADAFAVVNATGSVGRNAFTYLPSATAASTSTARTDWAADVSVGRYAPPTGYVAVGVEYQQRAQAKDASQLCSAISGTSMLQCSSVVIGAPAENTMKIGSVEWRRFVPGGKAAVDVTVARDFVKNTTAIDVPFYFVSSPTGGLTGGARVSWRSDTNDVAVAVFLGTALKLAQ